MGKQLDRAAGLAAIAAVFCASSALAGVNQWTTSGPNAPSVANLTISPADPGVLYLATGSKLFKSSDAGATWVGLPKPEGFTLSIQVDPSSPSTLYALSSGVYRSDDGGATWTQRSPVVGSTPVSLSIDSSNPANLCTAADGIYKSTNGGVNWTRTHRRHSSAQVL
jgi:photosystem II stability/assembly factor-like uncharacterized protein